MQQELEKKAMLSSEDIKQALFRSAGYGGRCLWEYIIYNRGAIATSELRIVFSSLGSIQMTCLLYEEEAIILLLLLLLLILLQMKMSIYVDWFCSLTYA
jgi:hypothetical protein